MIPLSVLREYMPKLEDEDLKELGPVEYDQSKVPEVSKKHAENVRRKVYLPDMTESFARGVEYAGLIASEAVDISNETKGRQDTVETQFNSIQQELTDKDPISAPEIITMRDGEATANQRLARDFGNINEQIKPTESMVGKPYSLTLWKENEERGVNPQWFGCAADGSTDDTESFQATIDYAIQHQLPIVVTGEIRIDGTLYFRKIYDRRTPLRIEGGGKLIKRNAGYLFTSDVTYDGNTVYAGNLRFSNITFDSIAGNGSILIDNAKILRVYFDNCDILNFDHLMKSTGETYAQTVYLNNVVVAGGNGYFVDVPEIYDFSFAHSVCEHRDSLVRVLNTYHSMRIIDNVIEGMTGQVANVRWGRNLDISDNYFEHNSSTSNVPYIEFTFGSTIDTTSAVISNNHILATDEQSNDSDYYLIKTRSLSENIKIHDNFANANLLDVLEEPSITPYVLSVLLTNRTQGNAKITKDYKRVPVQLGQGNLLTGYSYPNQVVPNSSNIYANTTVTKTSALENVLAVRAVGGGVLTKEVGFRTDSVSLRSGENVVVGIEGKPMAATSGSPQVFVSLIGEDGTVAFKQNTYHVRDISNIDNLRFISIPSGKITKTQKYYLKISIERDTAFGIDHQYFLIYNLYLQYGTIANKTAM